MKVSELETVIPKIEKMNQDIIDMEYHDKNTLSDPRKRLHRELVIPGMNESKDDIVNEIQEVIDEAKSKGLTEIQMSPSEEAEIRKIIQMVDMYSMFTNGALNIMDGKTTPDEFGNNMVDKLKDIYR